MPSESQNPISIVGIDTAHVGSPRNDGTPGSGLYRVPVKLNRVPSRVWADAFPDVWNRPPSFTTMHRPGIAHVSGDTIVLDGTTVEEVRDYHAATLKAVVAKLNDAEAAHNERAAAEERARDQQEAQHRANVHDVAEDVRFD